MEIVSLRNHYVHSGYYLADHKLMIRHDRKKKTPEDYEIITDYKWLIEQTNMMRQMVIDIVFAELLDYKEYHYKE